MPIDLASVLKQIGRNSSQNGNVNTFYYLVDTADIDFRVEGRIGTVGAQSGVLPDFSIPSIAYGQKYIVLDPVAIPVELGTVVDTIAAGDIIEKRENGWYIHLDVSATKTNGGALAYSKKDKKFYYYKSTTDGWIELGAGSLTGAAGQTWSIQFRSTDGSLSGDAGLLFNNTTNQLVLGSEVVIAFGDGTTQGTARNFFGVTGPTNNTFPSGMSAAGNTGDRLLIATGPSADPFRNYVRFGTGWFQTGVVGIGQGPVGPAGPAGSAGATGATGETGARGETGTRGETGYGFTAAFVSGDGNLYISTLFPNGTSGNERSIGLVKGNDGAAGNTGNTGSTGSTGYGFTAAFVSGDGNLYISTLFPSGESGNERSIGLVRGATGATGKFSIGLTVAEQQSYTTHTTLAFQSGITGTARKVAFLLADGSLTFDYVRNFDVFNRSEFEFSVRGFSFFTGLSDTMLVRPTNITLGGFSLGSYQQTVVTGGVFVESPDEGTGFPLYPSNLQLIYPSGQTITGSATQSADRSVTLRLIATGNDADGTVRGGSGSFTIRFRNDYMIGMTSAAMITSGSTGTEGTWFNRDFQSTIPVNQTLSGYAASATAAMSENYLYFAYPARLHSESSPPQFQIYRVGTAPLASGGMSLQGYGDSYDEGGLSTLNYTNAQGWIEPYKVWRSDKSFALGVDMALKIV